MGHPQIQESLRLSSICIEALNIKLEGITDNKIALSSHNEQNNPFEMMVLIIVDFSSRIGLRRIYVLVMSSYIVNVNNVNFFLYC